MTLFRTALLTAAAATLAAAAAQADTVAEFYTGRQITVIVNAGSGGLNGLYARTVADRMGGHLPGAPKIIIQAMPGAGGIKGANYCYNVAPKDGTVLCHLLMATPHAQVLGTKGVKFDAGKLTWIGRTATANSGLYLWSTEPVKTLADAKKRELILGATGKGSESFVDPTIINAVMGTKFKLTLGYRGGADLDLAMERREIFGQNGPLIAVLTRHPQWLSEKKVRYLYQSGSSRHPKLPDVPLLTSLAETKEQRNLFAFLSSRADIGRTYAAPPGLPADRTAALRKAFADTMKDPAFLADAAKRRIDVMPESAEFVEKKIAELLATPPEVVARAKKALGLK